LKQAGLVIGLFSLLLIYGGRWEAWTHAPRNLDDPETVIQMIVKANAEMDLKTLVTHRTAGENTVGYTIGGRKSIGWRGVKKAFEKEFVRLSGLT